LPGIRLEVLATQIGFETPPDQVNRLARTLATSKLYLSRFSLIDLGPGQSVWTRPAPRVESDTKIQATNPAATATISPISLPSVSLAGVDARDADKPVHILMSWEENEPDVIRVDFDSVVVARLTPIQGIALNCSYCGRGRPNADEQATLRFTSSDRLGGEFKLFSLDGSLGLGFQFPEPDQLQIRSVPTVDRISFQRSGELRPVSSILSGFLYLTDLDDKKLDLTSALIRMGGLSQFKIDSISLKTNEPDNAGKRTVLGFNVVASGMVRELTVDGRNVLPSRLRRMMGADLVPLAEVAAILFGALITLYQTLRSR
jgi:hypothetical protein